MPIHPKFLQFQTLPSWILFIFGTQKISHLPSQYSEFQCDRPSRSLATPHPFRHVLAKMGVATSFQTAIVQASVDQFS